MKKVLIADDDLLLQRLMRHFLERDGFASLHALNGREALNLAFCHQPDLIVMDIMMEDLDGLSTLRELRKNPLTHTTPVIMISTSTLDIARYESQSLGAQQFMI